MNLSKNTHFIALSGLALLVIELLSFAVISPLNVESVDYWYYPYQGKRIVEQNDWFYTYANRQFAMAGLALSDIVMPGRVEGMYYLHLLFMFVTALGMLYIFVRLLPRYKLFGFLLAAVYLLYSPFNNAVILYWQNPYAWGAMLFTLAIITLLEGSLLHGWRRWSLLLISGVLAWITARAYESSLPLLMLTPLLLVVLWRKINRELILISLIWGMFAGVGLLQFAVPYLTNAPSAWYQEHNRRVGDQATPSAYLQDTSEFMHNAFPVKSLILKTPLHYRAPAVLLAAIVLISAWLLRRRFPEDSGLPSPKELALLLGIGLGITFLGGLGFIYADLVVPYSTFFGAPGQAMVVLCVLTLVALGVQKLLRFSALRSLLVMLAIYFVVATQWHYEAQVLRTTYGTPFDKRIAFYQELVSFAPQLEPDTLLLNFNCMDDSTPFAYRLHYWESALGIRYLYGYIHGSEVVMGSLIGQKFDESGVLYDPQFRFDFPAIPAHHYTYDQVVLVECTEDGLQILDRFPADFTPPFAAASDYNPYSRIKREFIPDENARILAP